MAMKNDGQLGFLFICFCVRAIFSSVDEVDIRDLCWATYDALGAIFGILGMSPSLEHVQPSWEQWALL